MHFAQPHWLFIGALACLGLALLFKVLHRRRQAALEQFAARQLLGRLTHNVSVGRRQYKNILLLLAVFLCFAALARPQYGVQWVEVKRKGIDLLFALDASKSMLAEDSKPYRLKRAQLAILDFIRQLDGDRVGLLPFAGAAYLMCPLTLDYEAFLESLAEVDTELVPRGGTNIAAVIEQAALVLNNAANHKILIILTDGENLEGDAVHAAAEAAKRGLTIYTVGVGTSQGELIPLGGEGGKGFVKDKAGNFVTSRLDEKTLTAIADKSGGLYVPLGTGGEGLETIYQQKLALIPKEELAERRHKVPLERFEWPLAAALVLLVLELLVGERKKGRPFTFLTAIRRFFPRGGEAGLVLVLALSFGAKAYGSTGEEAFARGDYLQASEYYAKHLEKSPNDPELHYNYGTAAYKNKMYDDAVESFSKALKSDNVDLQKKAYYNRGNSQYQKGLEMQQADPKQTIDQWQEALASLEAAMKLDPHDTAASHNHEVVKKRLAELEKQQQKQQDQQEQKDQQQEQQQSGDSGEQKQDKGAPPDNQQQGDAEQPQGGHRDDGGNDDQTEEQQSGDSGAEENKGAKPDRPAPMNQEEQDGSRPAERAEQDAARQQQGKMTREEAERLLNALKNEESELQFVPSGHDNNQPDSDNDW